MEGESRTSVATDAGENAGGAEREPWQLTPAEYNERTVTRCMVEYQVGREMAEYQHPRHGTDPEHFRLVMDAARAGKRIPDQVLDAWSLQGRIDILRHVPDLHAYIDYVHPEFRPAVAGSKVGDDLAPPEVEVGAALAPVPSGGQQQPSAKAPKVEPWQISQEDFVYRQAERENPHRAYRKRWEDQQRQAWVLSVEQALLARKPVPPESLPLWAVTFSKFQRWEYEGDLGLAAQNEERDRSDHKNWVREALLKSLPVPSAVLEDYPDLLAIALANPTLHPLDGEGPVPPADLQREQITGAHVFYTPDGQVILTPSDLVRRAADIWGAEAVAQLFAGEILMPGRTPHGEIIGGIENHENWSYEGTIDKAVRGKTKDPRSQAVRDEFDRAGSSRDEKPAVTAIQEERVVVRVRHEEAKGEAHCALQLDLHPDVMQEWHRIRSGSIGVPLPGGAVRLEAWMRGGDSEPGREAAYRAMASLIERARTDLTPGSFEEAQVRRTVGDGLVREIRMAIFGHDEDPDERRARLAREACVAELAKFGMKELVGAEFNYPHAAGAQGYTVHQITRVYGDDFAAVDDHGGERSGRLADLLDSLKTGRARAYLGGVPQVARAKLRSSSKVWALPPEAFLTADVDGIAYHYVLRYDLPPVVVDSAGKVVRKQETINRVAAIAAAQAGNVQVESARPTAATVDGPTEPAPPAQPHVDTTAPSLDGVAEGEEPPEVGVPGEVLAAAVQFFNRTGDPTVDIRILESRDTGGPLQVKVIRGDQVSGLYVACHEPRRHSGKWWFRRVAPPSEACVSVVIESATNLAPPSPAEGGATSACAAAEPKEPKETAGSGAARQPWQMTLAEFRASKPKVTRGFIRYDSQTRANLAASHRLGHRQREAIGEYFYTSPGLPDRAFPSARLAVHAWHNAEVQRAVARGLPVRPEVLADYPHVVQEADQTAPNATKRDRA